MEHGFTVKRVTLDLREIVRTNYRKLTEDIMECPLRGL